LENIIYIASPYSNPDSKIMDNNFKLVSSFASELCSKGYIAFSPITYGHVLVDYTEMPTDWEFWENFCLSFLKLSSELWVYEIEGWDRSRGVAREIKYAIENNIKIKYIKP
jgi:hypothetical protein